MTYQPLSGRPPFAALDITSRFDNRTYAQNLLSTPLPPSVSEFASAYLHFQPNPHQSAILDAEDPCLLLLCSRQFGKTTLAAIKAAHHLLAHPGARVAIASPSARQSEDLLSVISSYLRALAIPLRRASRQTPSILLPNLSAAYALPSHHTTIRGLRQVSLLLIEEAAYTPDHLYHAVTPFQAAVKNPLLWLLSSAGPQFGFFYDAYTSPQTASWRRFRFTAEDCPHISPEFLARERASKPEAEFLCEYMATFAASSEQILSRDLLLAAAQSDYSPFRGTR